MESKQLYRLLFDTAELTFQPQVFRSERLIFLLSFLL